MPKLNQIIAIQAGRKTQAKDALTRAYHQIQKVDLLAGLSRVYRPRDENGETLPNESKLVQVKAAQVIERVKEELTALFDVVLTQDVGNTVAKADIVVNGVALAKDVPVTYLLFLEKQLVDVATFVSTLPVLDAAERWSYDENQDCYVSEPSQSMRGKKIAKVLVKYEATPQHPAQVDVVSEDVNVGIWTTLKFSGAIPVRVRNDMLVRVKQLTDAVKIAREIANGTDVTRQTIGESLLSYIFNNK